MVTTADGQLRLEFAAEEVDDAMRMPYRCSCRDCVMRGDYVPPVAAGRRRATARPVLVFERRSS